MMHHERVCGFVRVRLCKKMNFNGIYCFRCFNVMIYTQMLVVCYNDPDVNYTDKQCIELSSKTTFHARTARCISPPLRLKSSTSDFVSKIFFYYVFFAKLF